MAIAFPASSLPPHAAKVWDSLGASRLDSLNALRMVAFVLVLLDHFEVAGPLAGFGLPVFLILTGFLTTRSLVADPTRGLGATVRGLWGRRARRLLPGLYGYLLSATALLVASDIHVSWSHLASTALQAGNYYEAVLGPQESYLSHTWSLALQEQFVLVWPFVIFLLGRDARRLTTFTIVAIVAVWALRFGLALAGTDQSYLYRAFETRIDNILVGCLLALVVRRRVWARALALLVRRPVASLGAATVLLATSGCLQEAYGPAYRDTIGLIVDPMGLTVIIVLLVTFADHPLLRFTNASWLGWLGTISYGMYLYHPLAIQTVLHVSPERGPLQVAAAFALSTLAGAASYYGLERHFAEGKARTRAPERPSRPFGTIALPHGLEVASSPVRASLTPPSRFAATSRLGVR